jgi:glycosyltransferase involved in cell wall biosynthesis
VPGLSIITVVKDDPEGLQRTLASIDTQGEVDAEVLIIDGSKAPVNNVTLSWLPSKVVWQPPRGIYPAMNAGLESARGKYVYFLNAGDTLTSSDTLTRVLAGLHQAGDPVWAFGAVEFFNAGGVGLREPTWSYERELRRLFARGLFPAHQGIVATTESVRNVGGFDESYVVTADYKLMLQLSNLATPIRWEWPIARFYQGGTSSQSWWTALREFHRARREVFDPSGRLRLLEMLDTTRLWTRTVIAQAIGSIHK